MNFEEKTVNEKYLFKGRIINLRVDDITLPNGEPANREVVEHSGGVGIVAIDEKMDVYLVKQFRYPYKQNVLEIPAGKLNKGENPKECGERELLEEVGVVAKSFVELGEIYPSPGYCEEIITIYLATDLEQKKQNLDEDEFLEIVKLPFAKALEMAANGEIKDAKTVVGLFRAKNLLDKSYLI
jgi:ADP-ribose pyrophosphatase